MAAAEHRVAASNGIPLLQPKAGAERVSAESAPDLQSQVPVKSTKDRGMDAEARAERFLSRLGYEIVARNVICAGVEIDRIAWHEETLCFVEVRSRWRRRHGFPEETVGPAKQRRLLRGAEAFLSWHFERWPPVRFDVVAVVGRDIKVFAGAFDASGERR